MKNGSSFERRDKDAEKLIYQNEDVFRNYLYKIKDNDDYNKLTQKFKKDELKHNLGLESKLDKVIKENTIIQKVKNIFKTKDDLHKDDGDR